MMQQYIKNAMKMAVRACVNLCLIIIHFN